MFLIPKIKGFISNDYSEILIMVNKSYKIMIKNSTVILVTVLIIIGIVSHKLLDELFRQKAHKEIESLEIKVKSLELEPKVLNLKNEDLIYIPSYTFTDNNLEMNYELFRFNGETLVKL
jgi:hypothetical protein